jgi:hypothetical protein
MIRRRWYAFKARKAYKIRLLLSKTATRIQRWWRNISIAMHFKEKLKCHSDRVY